MIACTSELVIMMAFTSELVRCCVDLTVVASTCAFATCVFDIDSRVRVIAGAGTFATCVFDVDFNVVV